MSDFVVVTYSPREGRITAEHPNFKMVDREISIDVSSIQLNGGGLLNAKFQAQPIESPDGDTQPRTVEYGDLTVGLLAHKKIIDVFEKTKMKKLTGGENQNGKFMRGVHNGARSATRH